MTPLIRARLHVAANAVLLFAGVGAANAHVALSPGTAAPGSTVAAKLIVGHGCSGLPTTAIRLEIPAAIAMVHPMEAEGWTLTTDKRDGRIAAVTWTAAGKGKDGVANFDLHLQLPPAAGRLFFAAVQSCGATTVRWADQAADGAPSPEHAAPSINVGGDPSQAPAEDHSAHQG